MFKASLGQKEQQPRHPGTLRATPGHGELCRTWVLSWQRWLGRLTESSSLPSQTEPSTHHIVLLSLSTWGFFLQKNNLEIKAGRCRAVLLQRFWKKEQNPRELEGSLQWETPLPWQKRRSDWWKGKFLTLSEGQGGHSALPCPGVLGKGGIPKKEQGKGGNAVVVLPGSLVCPWLYPTSQIIFSHLKPNPEIAVPEYGLGYSLQCFLLLSL